MSVIGSLTLQSREIDWGKERFEKKKIFCALMHTTGVSYPNMLLYANTRLLANIGPACSVYQPHSQPLLACCIDNSLKVAYLPGSFLLKCAICIPVDVVAI